ncbi:hypothetical protein P3L51_33000 [Streptomyces sp. PSRA5]|uniref:hypothetical protein n=1 Tax=Streptomyces panacea TaxID=3035064 RepID=UPI00339C69CA
MQARSLPEDFPYEVERGNLGDALATIAPRESMHRMIEVQRGSRIREAMEMGATWYEMAAALDITPDEARTLLQEWINGQHRLRRGDVERAADNPLGLGADRHAEVLALMRCARGRRLDERGVPVLGGVRGDVVQLVGDERPGGRVVVLAHVRHRAAARTVSLSPSSVRASDWSLPLTVTLRWRSPTTPAAR